MILPIKDVLFKTVDTIEQRRANRGRLTGIPSGFRTLDAHTDGFQNSEFIVIGARPSVGKTAIALNMALNMIQEGYKVGLFSIEMASHLLMYRLISVMKMLDASLLKTGALVQEQMDTIVSAANELYNMPLYICDTPDMPIGKLTAYAQRMKSECGAQIIFVDYITLIQSDEKYLPRHEQVSGISRKLKALSRNLEVPVVACSQLKREVEGRVPTLADLRESGSIEQDADVVLLLHRERLNDNFLSNEAKLFISKNRNGAVGMVKMYFQPQYTRFTEGDLL